MALFGRKKKTEEVAVPREAAKVMSTKAAPAKTTSAPHEIGDHVFVLRRPRITEKASLKAEADNVFVFEVARDANKETIFRAVVDQYKVTPRKISITQTPAKNVLSRGKRGVQSGGKKAYVYLNKGDKIELI